MELFRVSTATSRKMGLVDVLISDNEGIFALLDPLRAELLAKSLVQQLSSNDREFTFSSEPRALEVNLSRVQAGHLASQLFMAGVSADVQNAFAEFVSEHLDCDDEDTLILLLCFRKFWANRAEGAIET